MRYWIDSKEGMMSLGTYPEIGLKDARNRRDEIKRQVANGENPGDVRKSDKAVRKAKQEVGGNVALFAVLPAL